MSAGGRGERPIRGGACALHNRPLAFNTQTLYDLLGTFAAGEGRSQVFLPIVLLGREVGFLIAKSRFECRGRERERR